MMIHQLDQSEAILKVRTAGTVTIRKSEAKSLKKTSGKRSLKMVMTSTSHLQSINQSSINSPAHRSNSRSLEKDFSSHFDVDEIEEGNLAEILQDETIVKDQVTSAA